MIQTLVIICLFYLPLLFIPTLVNPFEIPKVFVSEVLIELVVLIALYSKVQVKFRQFSLLSLCICFTLLLIGFLDFLLYPTPTGFFGNSFRLQGLFLFIHLLLFSCVTASHIQVRIPLRFLLPGFFLFFLGVVTLGTNETGRSIGTLGEPNALAAAGIVYFPFLFFYQDRNHYKKTLSLKIVSILITGIILVLAQSRAGIGAFALQILYLLLSVKVKKHLLLNYIFCCFLLLLVIILTFQYNDPNVLENRRLIWQTALTAGFLHPVTGGGVGNTQLLLANAAKQITNNLRFVIVDSSHNIFLDWWVQEGFIGLGLFLILIGNTVFHLVQKRYVRELVISIGLLCVLSFNPASIVSLLALWWIIGQGMLSIPEKGKTEKK